MVQEYVLCGFWGVAGNGVVVGLLRVKRAKAVDGVVGDRIGRFGLLVVVVGGMERYCVVVSIGGIVGLSLVVVVVLVFLFRGRMRKAEVSRYSLVFSVESFFEVEGRIAFAGLTSELRSKRAERRA